MQSRADVIKFLGQRQLVVLKKSRASLDTVMMDYSQNLMFCNEMGRRGSRSDHALCRVVQTVADVSSL